MDDSISKSQKKRDADALQKLGAKLTGLSATKLDTLPLSEVLRQAIDSAKSLKSHGAMRRQAQLIGKLMRAADHEAIIAAYQQLVEADNAQTAVFQELEQTRDKLINGGKEALTEFLDLHSTVDIQQLRQLIKKAQGEKGLGKTTGAGRALFRFLRDMT